MPCRIAVVGAGAVGSYFGGMLAAAGVQVTLIGRPAHVEAIRRAGLRIERGAAMQRVETAASTSLADAAGADCALLCVKTGDTESVAREVAAHLRSHTLLVSLQNGVDSIARIHRACGIRAAAAVVYVAVDLIAPGRVRHAGRGELVIGALPELPLEEHAAQALCEVATLFSRAGVPCRLAPDIRTELWTKMVMNCAYNALSALTRAQYGELLDDDRARSLMSDVTAEVVAVARANGVTLAADELQEAVLALGRTMPSATSSTAQDLARGRGTEIDALNGHVAREGERHGVPVPLNRALHTLVKLLERQRARTGG